MAAMTTMMSTPAGRMAPPARQGRTLRARATVTLTDKFVSTGIASRGAGAVTLPGSRVIVARASTDDRASDGIDAPARVHDATVVALEDAQDANIDGKQVRKIAVATAVFTAMVANCDIALAADAAAETWDEANPRYVGRCVRSAPGGDTMEDRGASRRRSVASATAADRTMKDLDAGLMDTAMRASGSMAWIRR